MHMLAQSKGERETEQKETGREREDWRRRGGTKTDNRKIRESELYKDLTKEGHSNTVQRWKSWTSI